MKSLLIAILTAAISAFASDQKSFNLNFGPKLRVKSEINKEYSPEFEKLLQGLEVILNENIARRAMESEANEAIAHEMETKINEAAKNDRLFFPVFIAICADKIGLALDNQKMRISPDHFLEVADFEAQLLAAAEVLSEPGRNGTEEAQNIIGTKAGFEDQITYTCINQIRKDALKNTNPNFSHRLEILVRFQNDLINRTKKILADWKTLHTGNVEKEYDEQLHKAYLSNAAELQVAIKKQQMDQENELSEERRNEIERRKRGQEEPPRVQPRTRSGPGSRTII